MEHDVKISQVIDDAYSLTCLKVAYNALAKFMEGNPEYVGDATRRRLIDAIKTMDSLSKDLSGPMKGYGESEIIFSVRSEVRAYCDIISDTELNDFDFINGPLSDIEREAVEEITDSVGLLSEMVDDITRFTEAAE